MVVNISFIGQNKSMSNNVCIQLSRQIRGLRIKHKLTQEALAEKAGISTKYGSVLILVEIWWKKGQDSPKIEVPLLL